MCILVEFISEDSRTVIKRIVSLFTQTQIVSNLIEESRRRTRNSKVSHLFLSQFRLSNIHRSMSVTLVHHTVALNLLLGLLEITLERGIDMRLHSGGIAVSSEDILNSLLIESTTDLVVTESLSSLTLGSEGSLLLSDLSLLRSLGSNAVSLLRLGLTVNVADDLLEHSLRLGGKLNLITIEGITQSVLDLIDATSAGKKRLASLLTSKDLHKLAVLTDLDAIDLTILNTLGCLLVDELPVNAVLVGNVAVNKVRNTLVHSAGNSVLEVAVEFGLVEVVVELLLAGVGTLEGILVVDDAVGVEVLISLVTLSMLLVLGELVLVEAHVFLVLKGSVLAGRITKLRRRNNGLVVAVLLLLISLDNLVLTDLDVLLEVLIVLLAEKTGSAVLLGLLLVFLGELLELASLNLLGSHLDVESLLQGLGDESVTLLDLSRARRDNNVLAALNLIAGAVVGGNSSIEVLGSGGSHDNLASSHVNLRLLGALAAAIATLDTLETTTSDLTGRSSLRNLLLDVIAHLLSRLGHLLLRGLLGGLGLLLLLGLLFSVGTTIDLSLLLLLLGLVITRRRRDITRRLLAGLIAGDDVSGGLLARLVFTLLLRSNRLLTGLLLLLLIASGLPAGSGADCSCWLD